MTPAPQPSEASRILARQFGMVLQCDVDRLAIAFDSVRDEEREACAKIADDERLAREKALRHWKKRVDAHKAPRIAATEEAWRADQSELIAKAIRARGEAKLLPQGPEDGDG